MPIWRNTIGFIRRAPDDSFGGKLTAPGGKVELSDGVEQIDGVPYFSAEAAAARELFEETGMRVHPRELHYFCSLTLPHNGRIVLSFFVEVLDVDAEKSHGLEWYCPDEIANRTDFAPGMKEEAAFLAGKLRL